MSKDVVVRIPKVSTSVTIKADWIIKRDRLIKNAESYSEIRSQDAFEYASEILREITKTSNALEAMRKDLAKPFQEAGKIIKTAADEAREPLEAAKDNLKSSLGIFATEQNRKAEEERERIEKANREALAKAEAERLKQEEERREKEEAGIEVEDEPVLPPPVPVILPQVKEAKATTARVSERLTWDLDDAANVPDEFKTFDPVKLNSWLKMNKDNVKALLKGGSDGTDILPGIMFRIETAVMSR